MLPHRRRTSLKDKRILITGASSGIGEALAYECARRGGELILLARTRSDLEEVRDRCHDPPRHHIEVLDLEKVEHLEAKSQFLWDTYGPIDILINNAGLSQRYFYEEGSLTVDQKIMNVNFWGIVTLTRPLVKCMVQRGMGQIVCVSSILGLVGKGRRTIYCASKHALRGFFDSLRQEIWATPVKITMIYPGYINTNLSERALRSDGKPYGKMESTHSRGVSVQRCAQLIVKAIEVQDAEVVVGSFTEQWAVRISRLTPGIFRCVLRFFTT